MAYLFPTMLALGATGGVVREGVGQVFAEGDLDATTPLAITDVNGLSMPHVQINDLGLTEAFLCDHPEVVWRSGPYAVPLSSSKGLRLAAEAAMAAAEEAKQAAQDAAALAAQAGLPAGGSPTQFLGINSQGQRAWLTPPSGSGSGIINAPAEWPATFPPASHSHQIGDLRRTGNEGISSVVQALLSAASATQARQAIGAGTGSGTSNLVIGTVQGTAADATHTHTANTINVSPVTNASGSTVQAVLESLAARPVGGGSGGGEVIALVYTSSGWPEAPATAPTGAKVRLLCGPTQYTGPTYPGVQDIYIHTAGV